MGMWVEPQCSRDGEREEGGDKGELGSSTLSAQDVVTVGRTSGNHQSFGQIIKKKKHFLISL